MWYVGLYRDAIKTAHDLCGFRAISREYEHRLYLHTAGAALLDSLKTRKPCYFPGRAFSGRHLQTGKRCAQ